MALNIEDLNFTEERLIVSMQKSKTNQYGDYEEKAIFYSPEAILCSIRTLQAWIKSLEKTTEALLYEYVKVIE